MHGPTTVYRRIYGRDLTGMFTLTGGWALQHHFEGLWGMGVGGIGAVLFRLPSFFMGLLLHGEWVYLKFTQIVSLGSLLFYPKSYSPSPFLRISIVGVCCWWFKWHLLFPSSVSVLVSVNDEPIQLQLCDTAGQVSLPVTLIPVTRVYRYFQLVCRYF